MFPRAVVEGVELGSNILPPSNHRDLQISYGGVAVGHLLAG